MLRICVIIENFNTILWLENAVYYRLIKFNEKYIVFWERRRVCREYGVERSRSEIKADTADYR